MTANGGANPYGAASFLSADCSPALTMQGVQHNCLVVQQITPCVCETEQSGAFCCCVLVLMLNWAAMPMIFCCLAGTCTSVGKDMEQARVTRACTLANLKPSRSASAQAQSLLNKAVILGLTRAGLQFHCPRTTRHSPLEPSAICCGAT